MKLQVFSIFDTAAQAYNQPFMFQTTGLAVRTFQEEAHRPDSNICKHPRDFALMHLGEFDDQNATFDLFETPRSLGLAQDFKTQPNGDSQ